MNSSKIEFILNNFLGMSYYDQLHFLEYLIVFLKENKMNKLSRAFDYNFSDYLEKIKLLLEFKDVYPKFNSNNRRLIRKITLEEFKEIVEEHHIRYSEEEARISFGNTYYGESKKYFEAKQIFPNEVQEFFILFPNLEKSIRYEFFEDMIFYYDRINHLSLPYPNNMLTWYRPIIKSIIGDELIFYYDLLYPEEQINLILKIIREYGLFKEDCEYYARKLENVKNDSKIIRILKEKALESCKDMFFSQNKDNDSTITKNNSNADNSNDSFECGYESILECDNKNYLIQQGLKQINPSSCKDWINFVDTNIDSKIWLIKATIRMLEKINSGLSFYEAEMEVYGYKFNLFGTHTKLLDEAVLRFCKTPIEYYDYLIKMKSGCFFQENTEPKKREISKKTKTNIPKII